jgi:hypothetical protein
LKTEGNFLSTKGELRTVERVFFVAFESLSAMLIYVSSCAFVRRREIECNRMAVEM